MTTAWMPEVERRRKPNPNMMRIGMGVCLVLVPVAERVGSSLRARSTGSTSMAWPVRSAPPASRRSWAGSTASSKRKPISPPATITVTMTEGTALDEVVAKSAVKAAGFISLRRFEPVQLAPPETPQGRANVYQGCEAAFVLRGLTTKRE